MKTLQRIALFLLVVSGLLILAWSVSRALTPTTAQRQAVRIMQEAWQPPGENAYWTLQHIGRRIPEAEREHVIAQDRAALQQRATQPVSEEVAFVPFASAAERYPAIQVPPQDLDLGCRIDEDCLDKARRDPEALRAMLQRQDEALRRITALQRYSHVRADLPHTFETPLPPMQWLGLTASAHALAFVDGRTEVALDGVCRDLGMWRGFAHRSDILLLALLSQRYATDLHGRLLADMLAALPADQSLPASCASALVPAEPDEASLCTAMRGEFAMSSNAIGRGAGRGAAALTFDADRTIARDAQGKAALCSPVLLEDAMASGRPWQAPAAADRPWGPTCWGNVAGCLLLAAGSGAYEPYARQAQDHHDKLQLLATLAWLRGQKADAGDVAALLAARPSALRIPGREPVLTDDGRLSLRVHDTRHGDAWSLPLPLRSAPGGD